MYGPYLDPDSNNAIGVRHLSNDIYGIKSNEKLLILKGMIMTLWL